MFYFVELTLVDGGKFWINMANVTFMGQKKKGTEIFVSKDEVITVKENPEQIFKMKCFRQTTSAQPMPQIRLTPDMANKILRTQ